MTWKDLTSIWKFQGPIPEQDIGVTFAETNWVILGYLKLSMDNPPPPPPPP